MGKIKIMLVLEGTYPYCDGGVSTWAHTLCNRVDNADFTLYAITANYHTKSKYTLPQSVKHVIQVPLWSPDEPGDYTGEGVNYATTVSKKNRTTARIVSLRFVPLLEELLTHIYSDNHDPDRLDRVFIEMWHYFKLFDFKETMLEQQVWNTYREFVCTMGVRKGEPEPKLIELTTGMRWLYRLLTPLSVPVPKVDVVHLTMSGFALLPALIASYKYNTPIVLTEHGVFIRERLLAINSSGYSFFLKKFLICFSESIARLAYHKADIILSVNQFNKKWELQYGAAPEKLRVAYNGIDHTLFKPRPKPEHLRHTPTVVALARIFELKDIITMIRSCAVVKRKIPNVQFLVYGDKTSVPEYTAECEALIKELGLQNNFTLKGTRNCPQELFCEGDLSILTSVSEGFPYTILESMSCGIPVVATDVGGTAEALNHQVSGFICKPRDPEDIGNRVVQLLTDTHLREEMSRNARKRIIENFTMANFIETYERVYHEVHYKPQPVMPQHDLSLKKYAAG
tara:strand:+ start:4215 stop:5750 length:1536 start_codon:yes stop_codon:yes gene_type:complete